MSRELISFSRRTLLRIASFSPFALLGFGSSSRGETLACDWPIQEHCGGITVETEKLQNVANTLWQAFVDGAGGTGIHGDVFQKAFEMSAPYVMCNFAKFQGTGAHADTIKCCVLCGEKAASKVLLPIIGKITVDDFEVAWCETRDAVMQNREARVRLSGDAETGAIGIGGGLGCG
jgi:hypothetical protein